MNNNKTNGKDPEKKKINFELLESYAPRDFILIKEPPRHLATVPKEKFLYINASDRIFHEPFKSINTKKIKRKPLPSEIKIKLVSTALVVLQEQAKGVYLIPKELEKVQPQSATPTQDAQKKSKDFSIIWKAAIALVAVIAFLFTSILANRLFENYYDEGINVAKVAVPTVVTVQFGNKCGAGVIIEENNGKSYILTNYHLIEKTGIVIVKVYGAEEMPITANWTEGVSEDGSIVLCKEDRSKDLALISINRTGLAVAKKAKTAAEYGQTVYAVGNPLDGGIAITKGIVSHPRIRITQELGDDPDDFYFINEDAIRIDAAIYPGNSGGGLFNKRGELLGIVFGKPKVEKVSDSDDDTNTDSQESNTLHDFAYAVPMGVVNGFLSGYFSR